MAAGFDYARGEIIISLDADLQNDPGDIPAAHCQDRGGLRHRQRLAEKPQGQVPHPPRALDDRQQAHLPVTGVQLHDYGCTLKAFRREVVKNIQLYGEMHRFIPAIASDDGRRHRRGRRSTTGPRMHGKSKYNISGSIRVDPGHDDGQVPAELLHPAPPDLRPVGDGRGRRRGFLIALWLSYQRLVLKLSVANRPLLLLAVLLIVIGIQFITLGLLAEIMVRAYHEASGKTIYVVREVIEPEPEEGRLRTTVNEDPDARPRAVFRAAGDADQRLFPDPGPGRARPSVTSSPIRSERTSGFRA